MLYAFGFLTIEQEARAIANDMTKSIPKKKPGVHKTNMRKAKLMPMSFVGSQTPFPRVTFKPEPPIGPKVLSSPMPTMGPYTVSPPVTSKARSDSPRANKPETQQETTSSGSDDVPYSLDQLLAKLMSLHDREHNLQKELLKIRAAKVTVSEALAKKAKRGTLV